MKGRIMKRALRVSALILMTLALTLPLSACGKKGDLLPPPNHSDPAEEPGGE